MLMVAVALVAIALGVVTLVRRRERFLRLASESSLRSAYAETTMGHFDHATTRRVAAAMEGTSRTEQEWEAILTSDRRRALHYDRLRRKYERAARYPWLVVEPDQIGNADQQERGADDD